MKPTSDKVFLDTNIIIYAHTDLESKKQKAAQQTISTFQTIISTQVLQETANTLVKKFNHSWADVAKVISEAIHNNIILLPTPAGAFATGVIIDFLPVTFRSAGRG